MVFKFHNYVTAAFSDNKLSAMLVFSGMRNESVEKNNMVFVLLRFN